MCKITKSMLWLFYATKTLTSFTNSTFVLFHCNQYSVHKKWPQANSNWTQPIPTELNQTTPRRTMVIRTKNLIILCLFIYYSDILVLFMANMQQKIVANAIKLTRLHQCDPIFFLFIFRFEFMAQVCNSWINEVNRRIFPLFRDHNGQRE